MIARPPVSAGFVQVSAMLSLPAPPAESTGASGAVAATVELFVTAKSSKLAASLPESSCTAFASLPAPGSV